MSGDLTQASTALLQFLRPLRPLLDAAEALQAAGGIEGAAQHAEARLETAQAAHEALKAEAATAQTNLDALKASAKDLTDTTTAQVATMRAEADTYVANRHQLGDEVLEQAKADGAAHLDQAKKDAADLKVKLEADLEGLKGEVAQHAASKEELRLEIERLTQMRDELLARMGQAGVKLSGGVNESGNAAPS